MLVIVEVWYLGEVGGKVIVNVLFGVVNLFGKLFVIFLVCD